MPGQTAASAVVLTAIGPEPVLVALLAAAGLPTSDLLPDNSITDHAGSHLQKCELLTLVIPGADGEQGAGDGESARHISASAVPVCCIGWEVFGSVALVRSLVVHSDWQGRGLGRRLVDALEERARNCQVETLYLLTESAVRFFGSLGYAVIERDAAPTAIASTAQFSGLCPDTATLMHKHLLS